MLTSKIGALRELLFSLLQEHERDGTIPTNGRFLFYELVQRRQLSKEETGARRPDQDMHDALIDIREDGRIPWDWIVKSGRYQAPPVRRTYIPKADGTQRRRTWRPIFRTSSKFQIDDVVQRDRSLDDYTGYKTIKDGVLARLPYIDLDPWRGRVPMILTESRSLAGVLRGIASEYRTRINSTNGQCGGFLRTNIAPALQPGDRVVYLGDLDLAGNQIEDNTRRVLEREIGGALLWERLALTRERVREHGLPEIIKRDWRYKDGRRHEAVETEAISQRVLIDILRDRLDRLLPEPLSRVFEREARQRRQIATLLRLRGCAADADAIGKITADLRQAADKIVGKVSGSGQFDLSPEMIEGSAKNFIAIHGPQDAALYAAAPGRAHRQRPLRVLQQRDRLRPRSRSAGPGQGHRHLQGLRHARARRIRGPAEAWPTPDRGIGPQTLTRQQNQARPQAAQVA
jgi:hypothetical protein